MPIRRTPQPGAAAPSVDPTPTEPIPTVGLPFAFTPTTPLPVSAHLEATAADPDVLPRPSLPRRHPLATTIAIGVAAVLLVSGITAWGVGSAVAASTRAAVGSASTTATTTGSASGAASALPARTLGGRVIVRATIRSIDGSTWQVTTRRGQSASISITSATRFGTRKSPADASDFSVGESVVIVATRTSTDGGTAVRIAEAPAGSGGRSADSSPTPTA